MRRTPSRPAPSDTLDLGADPSATSIRTFLIADVRGYTIFTQEHGDEAAAKLATRFAEIVAEHVEARGGSLVDLRGDEALAAFGSPREAIRAAADLQSRFLRETMKTPELPLAVGIGIDVGEAVAVEGGYRGGALNLAARLCSEARPGEILVSHNVAHIARTVEGLRYLDRGQLHFKGLSDPVHVVTITSEDVDVVERMDAVLPKKQRRRTYGAKLQFRLLGPIEVDAGRGPITLGGPKPRVVLAHLMLRANELVPAETLVDEVWGDAPPDRSRNLIQTYVSHLRKVLGHDRIETHAPGYRLRLDRSELDTVRFDELVHNAEEHAHTDPAIAVATFDEALALWRGPALADLADHPSLVAEAARLDELRLQTQEDRLEALLASGEDAQAIRDLEVLLAHHPLRERLWGFLMLALYREGRQAEALGAYQRAREVLAEELGIDPSPELVRLHERVLRQDPGLDLRGVPLRGYRLLEKIADGPNGVVFRAIQPHVERDVAIKIMHEGIASDPEFVRRFEQDSQAAAALEHPQVVPVYDYWREPGHAYVVARYLRGGSLRAISDRGEVLDPERALRVIEQVALALAFAHRQGVSHGNVTSSNVLFDGEGNAYLGDFLVGTSSRDPANDVRGLARLTREMLGNRLPPSLTAVVERAEGEDVAADAFADAAKIALEPGAEPAPVATDQRNPYKGLRAFTEADAHDFFGRGELTQRLVGRLREAGPGSRFLAVVGPSGCGKSSVVRAGLVPAIRRGALGTEEEPFVAEMFPGASPIDELEAALLRVSVRPISLLRSRLESGSRGLLDALDLIGPGDAEVVLIVDQFEELFTLTTDDPERELFLESLRVATADPESRLRVIVTLRADFYDRPLMYPRFGELLASRTEAVPPLTADELEQAIREPATQVGVRPEPGVVAEMIADVAHQPGALPLLQYALTELFDRHEEDRLTLAAYREIGGIAGALSARADRIHDAADAQARRAIKQVFLRLVTLGEGRQDTRRRVPRSELDALGVDTDAIEGVVRTFGRHRFLTFDRDPSTREPTVEIAHEALLTAWRRLRIWIDDARDDIREHERMARAGAEWRASGQDPSFLLRGVRLQQVDQWAGGTDLAIGKPEAAYLKASIDQRERDQEEEWSRHEREVRTERRSRRRLRGLVALFAVAAVVTGTLTVIANGQSSRADRERRLAESRELAAAAVANLDVDPDRSILLAMEAVRRTRSIDGTISPEAEEALHRAVTNARLERELPSAGPTDWSARGVYASVDPDDPGDVQIRGSKDGAILRTLHASSSSVTDVVFSPAGSTFATVSDDGRLTIWDASTGELVAAVAGTGPASGPSFSGDGSILAAAWRDEGVVRTLDVSGGHPIGVVHDLRGAARTALDGHGRRVAVATQARGDDCAGGPWRVYVINLSTDRRRPLDTPETCGSPFVAWSPNGWFIAAYDQIWDPTTAQSLSSLVGHTDTILSADWTRGAWALVTGSYDTTAKFWWISEEGVAQLGLTLAARGEQVIQDVAFSQDGSQVMTKSGGDVSGPVRLWDVDYFGGEEVANLPSWPLNGAAFVDGGRRAITSAGFGPLQIWDVASGKQVGTIGPDVLDIGEWTTEARFDASADGSVLAIDAGNGLIEVWDVDGRRERFSLPKSQHGWFEMSRDGRFLTVHSGRTVRIFDRSGRRVGSVTAPDGLGVDGAELSPDDRLLAIATLRSVTLWDWRRQARLATIPAQTEGVAFEPGGRLLATAGDDRTPEVWEVATGDLVKELPSQPGDIYGLAFFPDGHRLAIGSADGSIRLVDIRSGALTTLQAGRSGVFNRISFSPDGSMMATSSDDGIARIWALDVDDLLRIARQKLTRHFSADECQQYLHLDACPTR